VCIFLAYMDSSSIGGGTPEMFAACMNDRRSSSEATAWTAPQKMPGLVGGPRKPEEA